MNIHIVQKLIQRLVSLKIIAETQWARSGLISGVTPLIPKKDGIIVYQSVKLMLYLMKNRRPQEKVSYFLINHLHKPMQMKKQSLKQILRSLKRQYKIEI